MMTRRYAQNTSVPVSRSRDEIERTLTRYGADGFLYGWENGCFVVGFRMNGRQLKFVVEDPGNENKKLAQQQRQRWRALLLLIKAKLESVESEITVFDEEFLAHIVTNNSQTVYERIREHINAPDLPLLGPGAAG